MFSYVIVSVFLHPNHNILRWKKLTFFYGRLTFGINECNVFSYICVLNVLSHICENDGR